jgi:hypothetical protein
MVMVTASALYNGTEGSGWAPGTEPTPSAYRGLTDPRRPVLAAYHPYAGEAYLSDKQILAFAFAKGGLDACRILFEGTVTNMVAGFHQLTGEDGVQRTVWGYAADLDHAAIPSGWQRFYLEAVPADPTIDSRIIGPFWVKRKTGTYWDATLTFPTSAGGTYADLKAAVVAAKTAPYNTSSYDHIRIQPLVTHTHDLGPTAAGRNWGGTTSAKKGIIAILPDPGVELTILSSTWPTGGAGENSGIWRPAVEGLKICKGVKIDVARLIVLYQEPNQRRWHLAGCEIFDSNGRYNNIGPLGFNAVNPSAQYSDRPSPRNTPVILAGTFCTEISYHDVQNGLYGPQILRFSSIARTADDTSNPIQNLWQIQVSNDYDDVNSVPWRTSNLAMQLSYSGPATVATYSVSGGGISGANLRKLTLTLDGVSTDYDAFTYKLPSDACAAINAVGNGWTATPVSDTWALSGIGGIGVVAPTNCKNVTVNVVTAFDVHADGYQFASNTNNENVTVLNATWINVDSTQIFFFAVGNASNFMADVLFGNCSGVRVGSTVTKSQFAGKHDNVLFYHNNLINQDLTLRTTVTAPSSPYTPTNCEIAGCLFETLTWGNTATSGVAIANNHIMNGSVPAGATGTIQGGTPATLVPNYATGDFTPAGALLSNEIMPYLPFDANFNSYLRPRGAVRETA